MMTHIFKASIRDLKMTQSDSKLNYFNQQGIAHMVDVDAKYFKKNVLSQKLHIFMEAETSTPLLFCIFK